MTQTAMGRSGIESMHLTVRIGESLHAIPIAAVEEVLPALPVEPISQLPAFIRGVVFVRGHLIPVLSGAERLGVEARSSWDESQLICLRLHDRLIGLEVDEAVDLVSLSQYERLPIAQFGVRQQCLAAVVDFQGTVLRILNPEQLLLRDETAELDHISRSG